MNVEPILLRRPWARRPSHSKLMRRAREPSGLDEASTSPIATTVRS
jgi:hypothetical protein